MKSFTLLFACFFASISSLQAQIYADVTVSHGESPLGTFRILLHHDVVPRTVANFVGLATGERNWIDSDTGTIQIDKPYYDGLIFHRLIHTFMIQGGDPLGTGSGGPGYRFQDEFNLSLSHSEYVISMANSGANTNGSQFFITLSTPTYLDDSHSVFGEVIDDDTYPNSRALIDSFKNSENFPTNESDVPTTPISIDSVVISGPDLAAFDIDAWGLPEIKPVGLQMDTTTENYSIDFSRATFSEYVVSHSSDLETWTPLSESTIRHLETTTPSTLDVSEVSTGQPQQFFQAVVADYQDAPTSLNGHTVDIILTSSIPTQTLRLNFTSDESTAGIIDYENPLGTYSLITTTGTISGRIGLYYWDNSTPSNRLIIVLEEFNPTASTFYLNFLPGGTGDFTGQSYTNTFSGSRPFFGNLVWGETP